MRWLNPLDPRVRSAVVSGYFGRTPHSAHYATPPADRDEIDVIADSLEQASDTLTSVTAGTIHPPLQVVEEFVCRPTTDRLTPSLGPLREVTSVRAMRDDGSLAVEMDGWVLFGDSVRFVKADQMPLPWLGNYWIDLQAIWVTQLACACPSLQRLRVTYNAGSTITAKARAMVLALAHELYLQVAPCDDCGTCRLPTRTTNVIREGISYNMADPLTPGATPGAVGLPEVDLWVSQVNPYRVSRPSGVYSPEHPPPVVRSLISAREQFPPDPTGRTISTATIAARGVVT